MCLGVSDPRALPALSTSVPITLAEAALQRCTLTPWVPNATASHQHLVIAIAILTVGRPFSVCLFFPKFSSGGLFLSQ